MQYSRIELLYLYPSKLFPAFRNFVKVGALKDFFASDVKGDKLNFIHEIQCKSCTEQIEDREMYDCTQIYFADLGVRIIKILLVIGEPVNSLTKRVRR